MSELSYHSEIVVPTTELSAEVGKLNPQFVRWFFQYKPINLYLVKQRLVEAVIVTKKCVA